MRSSILPVRRVQEYLQTNLCSTSTFSTLHSCPNVSAKHCITSLTQHVKVWSEDCGTVFNETVLSLIYLQLPSFILHIIHLHLIILLRGNNSCNLFFSLLPTDDLCIQAAINKPSDHMRERKKNWCKLLHCKLCPASWDEFWVLDLFLELGESRGATKFMASLTSGVNSLWEQLETMWTVLNHSEISPPRISTCRIQIAAPWPQIFMCCECL